MFPLSLESVRKEVASVSDFKRTQIFVSPPFDEPVPLKLVQSMFVLGKGSGVCRIFNKSLPAHVYIVALESSDEQNLPVC